MTTHHTPDIWMDYHSCKTVLLHKETKLKFNEFLTHWWADFPTGYCPIDRGSEVKRFYRESLTIYWCQCGGSTFSSVILRPWVEVRARTEPRSSGLKGKHGEQDTTSAGCKYTSFRKNKTKTANTTSDLFHSHNVKIILDRNNSVRLALKRSGQASISEIEDDLVNIKRRTG